MKQKIFSIAWIAGGILLLQSCKKNEISNSQQENQLQNNRIKSQFKNFPRIEGKTIKIDLYSKDGINSLISDKKLKTVELINDTTNANGHASYLRSTEMPAVSNDVRKNVFLGAIIKGDPETIEKLPYITPIKFSVAERNPITIYADFPTDSISREVAVPSPIQDNAYIRDALKSGSGQQVASFNYSINQFKKFEELKASFGADINISGIFKLTVKDSSTYANAKTLVRAEFTQENFNVNVEPPIYDPFLKDPVDMSKIGSYDPLIVSSITYGRKGILTMASDSSYSSVQHAIKATFNIPGQALKQLATGDTTNTLEIYYTKSDIKILQESEIKIYLIGVDGKDQVESIKGVSAFAQAIINGAEFSSTSPGVPLYFSLSYMSDFTSFWNYFWVSYYN